MCSPIWSLARHRQLMVDLVILAAEHLIFRRYVLDGYDLNVYDSSTSPSLGSVSILTCNFQSDFCLSVPRASSRAVQVQAEPSSEWPVHLLFSPARMSR